MLQYELKKGQCQELGFKSLADLHDQESLLLQSVSFAARSVIFSFEKRHQTLLLFEY